MGGAVAGDWDGDGLLDIALRTGTLKGSRVEIHRNLGKRRFERSAVIFDVERGDGIVNYMAKGDVSVRECGDAVLFSRGDLIGEGRATEQSIREILRWLFLGEGRVEECLDAADVDDDGAITVADAVILVLRLFGPWRTLPTPPYCGTDRTPDRLDCKRGPGCP